MVISCQVEMAMIVLQSPLLSQMPKYISEVFFIGFYWALGFGNLLHPFQFFFYFIYYIKIVDILYFSWAQFSPPAMSGVVFQVRAAG